MTREEVASRPFNRAAKRRAEEAQRQVAATTTGAVSTTFAVGVRDGGTTNNAAQGSLKEWSTDSEKERDTARRDNDVPGREHGEPGQQGPFRPRTRKTDEERTATGVSKDEARESLVAPCEARGTAAPREEARRRPQMVTWTTTPEWVMAKPETGITVPYQAGPERAGPIRGKDNTNWSTELSTTVRRGSTGENGKHDEVRRGEHGETLQLTDDEFEAAQKESRLVQRLLVGGEYRGRLVNRKHGLVVITTTDGDRVVLPPRPWAVAF
ncbi:hypothetical protein JG687_00015844 [Phytophthora cactorum]|uniref:Uncharacterized protein n=1 Tax=Phytophthora cactorum TaxID=29920 RepID=A0A8T1TTU5_9STRA|nr:hypothetical protein PC120_g20964 [Phytophthora cactorum]KAG3044837.1 hypothetical protein PC121_g21657 [Phytophthora cactorum]KAG4044073.1 hypothetical protein PC123_g20462 [Phytophthora cactorum]KAG6947841.1 hypothetical protein JG687_00015844 [Phytophthora cactorum]